MTVATISGLTIRQLLVERGDWVFLGSALGTSAASYISDTERLQGTNLSSTMFEGAIVRISSGTRVGETSMVDYLDGANGRLYLTPDLTGALTAADTYEIWLRGLDPDIIDRLRDDCLQKFCSQWRIQPVSELPDGDMDSSGVTSWTAAGGATRAKAFSAFPDAHSRRELAIVHTTAATDYVKSDSVYVQPGERYFLQVPVRAYVTATSAPATASITIRDITQTADVSLGGHKTTHIGRGQGWISLLFTIPAGCYEIQLWLKSDTAASTSVWGPISFHKRGKTRKSLPDRITTRKRVGTFFELTQINSAVSEQADNQYKFNPLNTERIQVGGQVEVNFSPPTGENAIMYYERGYFDRLSATYFTIAARTAGDAATTDCQREYIAAKLARQVSKWMLDKYGADWQDDWVRACADDNYWEGQMGPEPKLVFENETPVYVPQLRV